MPRKKTAKQISSVDAGIPAFCDFVCPYADFAPADTAGICRTMSAVWCKQLGELVNKNARCEWRRRQEKRG